MLRQSRSAASRRTEAGFSSCLRAVYLAWQLISGAIGEKDWQTTKLIGVIAGVVFAAVGIWLLIRNLRAESKKSEAAQQPEDPENKEGEDET